MKMNKKIILIVLMFVLISCSTNYKEPKYKTSALFKTEKYEYKISYPKDWVFFKGAVENPRFYRGKNSKGEREFLETTAVISKTYSYNEANTLIRVFILDKNTDNKMYQSALKNTWFYPLVTKDFSNPKDEKLYIPYDALDKWYLTTRHSSIEIYVEIGENKVIMFYFKNDEDVVNKEQLGKEFYNIINSLQRNDIK